MGKGKKKKKKKEFSIINEIDRNLISQFDEMVDDIETYQYQMYLADKKANRKNKKKKKKKENGFYDVDDKIKVRKKIVKDMEEKDYLSKFTEILKDIGPIVVIMGRLIAALILAILSIDSVKRTIKPETLAKMERVFCMAIST